jgi:hypothetical protein
MSSDCGGGKEEEGLGSNERILSTGRFYGVPVGRRDEETVLELCRKHANTIALQNLPGRPCLRCVKQKRVLRAEESAFGFQMSFNSRYGFHV